MSKRAKLLTISVAMLLLLTVGLTTFVLAQESPAEEGDVTESPKQTFISRVANIIGVEEEQLADAFKQAKQEMTEEAVERCLQYALDNEYIDEQKADQIREWKQNLPDVLKDFGNKTHLYLKDKWQHQEWPYRMPCQ